jgi:hypothetical protein
VLARLDRPRRLRVVGAGRGALHLDLDGLVVTVATRRVPMMANAVAAGGGEAPRAVAWDPARPPAWDPVPPPPAWDAAGVRALGDWLAARVAVPHVAPGAAASRLLGRGPGLTPEGDDVLAGPRPSRSTACWQRARRPRASGPSPTSGGWARPRGARWRRGSPSRPDT